jgi:8-oxo-dGTP diphosphatase
MKNIPVTCALIIREGKVLAAQRGERMDLPGSWEFPGGKVEPAEDPQTCLIREIKEELSIDIEIHEEWSSFEHHYPEKIISLIPFVASWKSGQIQLLEHEQIIWLGKNELFSVDWAPADVPIVHELFEKWVKLVDQNES